MWKTSGGNINLELYDDHHGDGDGDDGDGVGDGDDDGDDGGDDDDNDDDNDEDNGLFCSCCWSRPYVSVALVFFDSSSENFELVSFSRTSVIS